MIPERKCGMCIMAEKESINYIINEFQRNGIAVSDKQAEQFYTFYSMLIEKNKVMNLTAITEFEDVVIKHFIDSAVPVKYNPGLMDAEKDIKIIDIGTGAGFPGIPLKILCPEIEITLLDSLNKRILFLNDVIRELGLKKITTIHSRAEELAGKPEHREKYSYAVSRAVSNLTTLVEYSLPFVKEGGIFYSYKGTKTEEEIAGAEKAIKVLGGKISNIYTVDIMGTDYDHKLIEISKVSPTPKKYPRGGNKPSTDPIV